MDIDKSIFGFGGGVKNVRPVSFSIENNSHGRIRIRYANAEGSGLKLIEAVSCGTAVPPVA